MEEEILAHIKTQHIGRGNAIRSPCLEARFCITGRKLRRCINNLRAAGYPVCSDDSGYYYAETLSELMGTIRQIQSRIIKIAVASRGLTRAAALFSDETGQISLPMESEVRRHVCHHQELRLRFVWQNSER